MALLSRNQIVGGFIAGALSVLVFHQGLVFLLNQVGLGSYPSYVWTPTQPLGVPQVLSLAFWGGLWGIAWAIFAGELKVGRWLGFAFLFDAILPPLVLVAVVAPLKGIDSSTLMNLRVLAFRTAGQACGAWTPRSAGASLASGKDARRKTLLKRLPSGRVFKLILGYNGFLVCNGLTMEHPSARAFDLAVRRGHYI
jgi:hypothetical protein